MLRVTSSTKYTAKQKDLINKTKKNSENEILKAKKFVDSAKGFITIMTNT
jgi:hypothetical protein